MSRKRYTEKQRQALVAKFERSDTSAAAFCRKHRINYQSFLRWRRAAGPPSPDPSCLLEAAIRDLKGLARPGG